MASSNTLGKYILATATVLLCPVAVLAALGHSKLFSYALSGILALIVAVYIGLRHPLWLYWMLALVLGAIPFGYVPGVHIPLYLLFSAGILLAALIHPSERSKFSRLEIALVGLVVASALSVVVTGIDFFSLLLFGRWAIATLVVIALLRLSRENLARFGRIFVCAAAVNALAGVAMATVDQQQRLLKPLKILGYGVGPELRQQTALYAYSDEGATLGQTLRLGGTWILPNSAGLAMTIALAMCIVLFRGWLRSCLVAIFLVALMLTLSRSMIFSLFAGLVLVLLFHAMRSRDRAIAIGVITAVAAGAFLTPSVRTRILATFTSEDKGRSDRVESITEFPHKMADHWVFGLGWSRPEFRSGQAAYSLNYVSNAPLLTVYRGGLICGILFVAILLIGCVMAYRALRSDSLPYAIFGGIFIGIAVVSCNLQQSVVDMPGMTVTFSILLAFMVYVYEGCRLSRAGPALIEEPGAPLRAQVTVN
jgi:polysaccharide biosynthesis protein PslJ